MWFKKTSPRRQAIREDVAEAESQDGAIPKISGSIFLIGLVFCIVAAIIQFWPGEPFAYREGQIAPYDLRAPVEFSAIDPVRTETQREAARASTPPVLVANQDALSRILSQIKDLRDDAIAKTAHAPADLAPEIQARFPGLTPAGIKWLQDIDINDFQTRVRTLVNRGIANLPLVSKKDGDLLRAKNPSEIKLTMSDSIEGVASGSLSSVKSAYVIGEPLDPAQIRRIVMDDFPDMLAVPLTNYIRGLAEPTYKYSDKLTTALADRNAEQITVAPPTPENSIIVRRGEQITTQQFHQLQEADREFQRKLTAEHPWAVWLSRLGRMLVVLLVTAAGALYVARMTVGAKGGRQSWAVCLLLLLMLVVAKLGIVIAPQSLYGLGLAPTLLATIILVIAYNPRFALGLAALHGLLVTITLGQGIDFYIPLLAGIAAFSFGLAEIRTPGKLIEVGFVASAALFVSIWAIGLARMAGWGGGATAGPWVASLDIQWIEVQSLWAAGAGMFTAMFALAVLPSIERFHMTTAMTLLELCDASRPLLRRLSQEAAGTFNHSLTVGIMAEAAGNAIGANGLLCRVGAYYHDVGKLSKPQYFIENQAAGHPNRHDKLSPAMSLLIIVGHVKDGIELAREYALPWIVHQFIGQHHGTTLVEYFYHAAKKRAEQQAESSDPNAPAAPEVSDSEFRYPGPKPQTRESAIVMICDGCESAVRAIEEPTAGRIESTVHNMIMKRLMDRQFSECDLTLRDLGLIEETLIRTLAAIHHGRVAYPSDRIQESDQLARPA